MKRLRRALRSTLARMVVAVSYGTVLVVARLCGSPRRWRPGGRILVTGTFHNPGWFLSHLRPLALSGMGEVVVVADGEQPAVDGVRLSRPPAWLQRCLGRAPSRLVWMLALSLRRRPDLYMGYHILPNSVAALALARIFGRPACYQMTGGPVEVLGGGFRSFGNPLLTSLPGPSPALERLALAVVRQFDLVVVRGTSGARFLADHGLGDRLAIVPGSVDGAGLAGRGERVWDLVFVGRLVEGKQPLEFLEIVAAVSRSVPRVRAALVGDGPLRAQVEQRVASLRLGGRVDVTGRQEDVGSILARSRVFVLPSLSEGLSIALAEAMMAGAVPLASRVGDLADLVTEGVTGYLLEPHDREGFVRRANTLLHDPALWRRLSEAAAAAARAHMDVARVAALWSAHLGATMSRAGAGLQPGTLPRPAGTPAVQPPLSDTPGFRAATNSMTPRNGRRDRATPRRPGTGVSK